MTNKDICFEDIPQEYQINKTSVSSPGLQIVSQIFLWTIPLYVLFCIFIFLCYRSKYKYLYKRNLTMLIIYSSTVLIEVYIYAYRHAYEALSFKCDVLFSFGHLATLLATMSLMTRLLHIAIREKLAKGFIDCFYNSLNENKPGMKKIAQTPTFNSSKLKLDKENKIIKFILLKFFCLKLPKHLPYSLGWNYFWSIKRVLNTFVILFTTSYVAIFCYLKTHHDCVGCALDYNLRFNSIKNLLLLTFGAVILYCTKDIKDSLNIRKEFFLIGVTIALLEIISIPIYLTWDDAENQRIFCLSFVYYLYAIAILTISFPYQVYLAKQGNKNSKKDIFLSQLISTKYGKKAFLICAAENFVEENVHFYLAATDWRKQFNNQSTEENRAQARKIFDLYISKDGCTVNISEKTFEQVSTNLNNENISISLFDRVKSEVHMLILSNVLIILKTTEFYQAYIGNFNPHNIQPNNVLQVSLLN